MSAWRLAGFYIDVSNNADGTAAVQRAFEDEGSTFQASETRIYTCDPPIIGRVVRIRFPTSKTEFMQLCEIQVLGSKWTYFLFRLISTFYRPTRVFKKYYNNVNPNPVYHKVPQLFKHVHSVT